MRPFDPRLLRYASAVRGMLAVGGMLALLRTGCVVAFAWLTTQLIVRAIAGAQLHELSGLFAGLMLVILVRGLVLWLSETISARGGAAVIGQLRSALTDALGRLGPAWLTTRSTAVVTVTVGHGLDALDGYFTKYLPQLILTVLATPALVAAIFWEDATSGIIVLITLPIIPVFMMLVGWATQAAQDRQWETLASLSRGFLDVVNGLSTLKLFGRQHRQSARIRAVSDEYRVHTMDVLRISFLSGFVLELAASLSVAVVAVAVGLRLLNGQLDLSVGLFVLLLAPEAFLPVRNVGAGYHAATEGIQASQSAFEILDAGRVLGSSPMSTVPCRPSAPGIVFEEVTVRHGESFAVEAFSGVAASGELTVLSAPSGAGKTSVVSAALGFVPFDGRIEVSGVTDALRRRERIAWAGQHPALIAGTVASNVALGVGEPDGELVANCLRAAAAPDIDPSTVLDVGGAGLSGGQAQRVAVARALYRMRSKDWRVLVLDEPTSALDETTEAQLLGSLLALAHEGAAVLVVSHREAVVAAADAVLTVGVLARVP